MEMSNCSRSSGGDYLGVPCGKTCLSGSGEVPRDNDQRSTLTYESLYKHAGAKGEVKLEQGDQFFVITPKLNNFTWPAPYLGWKIHLTVNPKHLKAAFFLAAPILIQRGLCFKVINLKKLDLPAEQITIYLEEEGKLVKTEEEVRQMIEEINNEFESNGIGKGTIPDSDAQIVSPFSSMRCDKCKPLVINRTAPPGYVPAHTARLHSNPLKYPNPFSHLLMEETKPFDPMKHLEFFNLGVNNENIFFRLIDTMKACINEFTDFENLGEVAKEMFVIQYCSETGSDNAEFFKKEYKNKPEILLAVKQAFTIVFMYEAVHSKDKSWYFECINSSQFSKRYPFDDAEKYPIGNSFKKLLMILEGYANKQIEQSKIIRAQVVYSLIGLYVESQERQKDSIKLYSQAHSSNLIRAIT